MNKEQKREVIRKFLQHNPTSTYLQIKKRTKIKIERVYDSMGDAYNDAGISLPKQLKKRSRTSQKKTVIAYIKQHPKAHVPEIQEVTKVNISRVFGSIKKAYAAANITYQEKDVTSGIRNPQVMKRCLDYEKKIFTLLSEIGEIIPKKKTRSGRVADCLFKHKEIVYVVEIKDFRARNNITMSQIKQLLSYMKELNIQRGLLICPKESFPRRNPRNIYKEGKTIEILSEKDLRGRSINPPYN